MKNEDIVKRARSLFFNRQLQIQNLHGKYFCSINGRTFLAPLHLGAFFAQQKTQACGGFGRKSARGFTTGYKPWIQAWSLRSKLQKQIRTS
jgi:hypothetical protein